MPFRLRRRVRPCVGSGACSRVRRCRRFLGVAFPGTLLFLLYFARQLFLSLLEIVVRLFGHVIVVNDEWRRDQRATTGSTRRETCADVCHTEFLATFHVVSS